MGIQLTYDSLGDDGLREIFQRGLVEVIGNIEDDNTDYKKVRKLTVEVTFKPNEARNFPELTYSVKTALAPVKPVHITAMTEKTKNGEVVLTIPEVGTDPAQHELPINVSKLPSKEAANG